jgi:peptide/nickel transport system permease protein
MLAYIIRRIGYAIPILLGVNFIIFALFFFVNTPDQMARNILGDKLVTQEQIDDWKRQHSYDLPYFYNSEESFPAALTQTIFWQKSMRLFIFDFGKTDMDNSNITDAMLERIPYSLAVTVPSFFGTIVFAIIFAMLAAFYRGTYIDFWTLIASVFMMSISPLFYIIVGQAVFAIELNLVPVSGSDTGIHALKFLFLPWIISIVAGFGGGVRYYRTVFLEEINRDYIRTARSKGLSEGKVLFKHALKNAMLPIITNVVVQIPFLIMGSILLENFFGIPGLGSYLIDAIAQQDFAVIRSMVFLGACLYIAGLILVDISYTMVDPRIRLK